VQSAVAAAEHQAEVQLVLYCCMLVATVAGCDGDERSCCATARGAQPVPAAADLSSLLMQSVQGVTAAAVRWPEVLIRLGSFCRVELMLTLLACQRNACMRQQEAPQACASPRPRL